MLKPNIYIASKIKHAYTWTQLAEMHGHQFNFVATWPANVVAGETDSEENAVNYWPRDLLEVSQADFLLCYVENRLEEEHLRGTLVEVGAALAGWKTVLYVGSCTIGTWHYHPKVLKFATVDEALRFASLAIT